MISCSGRDIREIISRHSQHDLADLERTIDISEVEEDEDPDVIIVDNVDIPELSEEGLREMASHRPIQPRAR